MLKIEKTKQWCKIPSLCSSNSPKKLCQSTHTYTQARFTNNTRIYHIHAERRWSSEKGTTQGGFRIGSYSGERGVSFWLRLRSDGFTNDEWTGCSRVTQGLIDLARTSDSCCICRPTQSKWSGQDSGVVNELQSVRICTDVRRRPAFNFTSRWRASNKLFLS